MLENIDSLLQEKENKPTAMRLQVLDFLLKQQTAVRLNELEASFHRADRITLYRTLKTFEEKGLVHSIEDGTGSVKYALCDETCRPQASLKEIVETIVIVAVDRAYAGYITIADKTKKDAPLAVRRMRELGVKKLVMLSGDKDSIVQKVARELKLDEAHGGLLPQDKVTQVERLKAEGRTVAFVGDGINDAPVITLADVGMAMGGLGSDAAIETADVVIQTDNPARIATAINIG